jgi:hypothetical protein
LKQTNTAEESALVFRSQYEKAEVPHDSARIDAANQFAST